MAINGVMMQYFEWDLPNDGKLWNKLNHDAEHLADKGITAVWIPPVFKGMSQEDVGYGIYDLYDLGEFDQKGTTRTKYGTRDELIGCIRSLHNHGIKVYADVVLNHKAGADHTEEFQAIQVDEENRYEEISDEHTIEGWTHFSFEGRGDEYSDFEWHWYHFTGIDLDVKTDTQGVFRIVGEGKDWANGDEVSNEKGNFDYLMFADVDYNHPEVIEETKKWVKWFIEETNIDGIRLDAVKHIESSFMNEFVDYVRAEFGEDFYFVAEYWDGDPEALTSYLESQDFDISMMDVRFHYALHEASVNTENFDMAKLFDGSLYRDNPSHATTFVDNHDSQPGQSLESSVETWFKPIAYGIILLSSYGYPCIFYADYYGYTDPEIGYDGDQEIIDKLLDLRKNNAYGETDKYLDDNRCIGFVRSGDEDHPEGCAVIISSGDESEKVMFVGDDKAGLIYTDALGHREEEILIEEDGSAKFIVNAGSISVWVPKED